MSHAVHASEAGALLAVTNTEAIMGTSGERFGRGEAADGVWSAGPVDVLLERAVEAWQADGADYRSVGEVVRDCLADPANRAPVVAWLVEMGLADG